MTIDQTPTFELLETTFSKLKIYKEGNFVFPGLFRALG